MFMTLSINAQYLNFDKTEVIKLLKKQKTPYTTGITQIGNNFIEIPNVNSCSIKYFFNSNNICYKEVINIKNDFDNIAVMIMDLDEKHYITLDAHNLSVEESYGLVNVYKAENTYTLTIE